MLRLELQGSLSRKMNRKGSRRFVLLTLGSCEISASPKYSFSSWQKRPLRRLRRKRPRRKLLLPTLT